MPTYNQLAKKKVRVHRKMKLKTPALGSSPQKKGSCIQVLIKTPRKPSSGKRKVIRIVTGKHRVNCHIPGIGHDIQRYATVLIRGCRVRDIPAMKYRVIRGKFDAQEVYERRTSRSKYGKRTPIELKEERLLKKRKIAATKQPNTRRLKAMRPRSYSHLF